MHLPKRFSHWAVDTLRAVPWIGPAPIAWAEDEALALRDAYRRVTFQPGHDATDVVATADPPPPPLDTSQASVEEAHWPPPSIATIWKSPEPAEGEWVVPDVPWLRRVPGVAPDAPSPFYQTFVRPDEDRPYARVLLVAMDMRQLDLQMEAGVEDPEPLTGPHGTGRIPREPAVYRRVVAAFNGAFKTEHGHYGMMVKKRVLLPPVPGAATVVVLDDGRVGFGTWGTDKNVGGIVGVADDEIDSFRQNLDPLIDHGQTNPTGRNLWGFTLPGKGAQTERTGLCVTTSGHLLYAWGDDLSATSLAKAMQMGGCDYAMHLDMNPYHTGFLFLSVDDLAGRKYRSQLLTTAMSIPVDRYIQYAPKDFFYVMVHDPTPPALAPAGGGDGAVAWSPDDGAQPPPRWMPGRVEVAGDRARRATWIWSTSSPDGRRGGSAPGRRTRRPRRRSGSSPGTRRGACSWPSASGSPTSTGPSDSPPTGASSSPCGAGRSTACSSSRPTGSSPWPGRTLSRRSGPTTTWSSCPSRCGTASWWPHRVAVVVAVRVPASGPSEPRAVLGETPSGRWMIARGAFASESPLAQALARAGCTRALVARSRGPRHGLARSRRHLEPPARRLRRIGPLRRREPLAPQRLPLRRLDPRRPGEGPVTPPSALGAVSGESDDLRRIAFRSSSVALGGHVARALIGGHSGLLVPGRLAGARQVDPVGLRIPHIHVHERAVRVVAAARVSKGTAEIPQLFVPDALDPEIERLAEVVVRVGGVLGGRVGAIAAHHLERPAPEVVRDDGDEGDEARIGGMGRLALPHQALERPERRRRDLPVAVFRRGSGTLRPAAWRGSRLVRSAGGPPGHAPVG